MIGGQRQEGGDGARQYQVAGDLVIHEGVSEQRAAEIARHVAKQELERFSAEANALGSQRIEAFSDGLIGQFAQSGQLGAFADPAFQVLLRKAQMGAASTDRESDYDLLVRLLDDRVKRGADRHIRAGLDQAVQIVDQTDGQALLGLTVLQAIQQFGPMSGFIAQGLDVMDGYFKSLRDGPLPDGTDWLDHLDVLGAVRVMHLGLGTLRKFDDFYPEAHLNGYLCAGIEADSGQFTRVREELSAASLDLAVIEHELRPGFLRPAFATLAIFEARLHEAVIEEERRETALQVAKQEFGLGQIDPELRQGLVAMVEERPYLSRARTWWDAIPTGVQITAVGRVLATANAKRLDTGGVLPALR